MSTDDQGKDEALLKLIQERDEKALEMLYDRYSRLVYSLALRIVGIAHVAEEVTQEIFLKIWKNADSFDKSKGKAFSWLVAVSRRHAIDKTRSKAFKLSTKETNLDVVSEAIGVQDEHSDSVESFALGEESRIIKQALKVLPKQDRNIIELAYFEGLTHKQIATRLSMPLGTVKTRLRKSIIELRKKTQDKF